MTYTREELGRKLLFDLSEGHIKDAFALVSEGARLDVRNGDGATAINIAACKGHTEMVQRLIDSGVDVNQQDNRRDTPLMWAASNGHLNVVEKLVRGGAKVDMRNKDGETAADIAQGKGYMLIVDAILDVQIAERKVVEESWNNITVDTGQNIQVSKPLQLKLPPRQSFARL